MGSGAGIRVVQSHYAGLEGHASPRPRCPSAVLSSPRGWLSTAVGPALPGAPPDVNDGRMTSTTHASTRQRTARLELPGGRPRGRARPPVVRPVRGAAPHGSPALPPRLRQRPTGLSWCAGRVRMRACASWSATTPARWGWSCPRAHPRGRPSASWWKLPRSSIRSAQCAPGVSRCSWSPPRQRFRRRSGRGPSPSAPGPLFRCPRDRTGFLSHLAEFSRPRAASRILGVVGGCGGAGTSSFAARLAAAARTHGSTVLIDADPLGGGLDLLIEAPEAAGIGWADVSGLGPDDGEALHDGLPAVDDVRLLAADDKSGPAPEPLARVLTALRPLGSTVVVDLADGLVPDCAEHLDQLLLVVPASDHAVRATARRLRSWQLPDAIAQVVVRRGARSAHSRRGVPGPRPPPRGLLPGRPRRGGVPLFDVRRRGADRSARRLMAHLPPGAGGMSAGPHPAQGIAARTLDENLASLVELVREDLVRSPGSHRRPPHHSRAAPAGQGARRRCDPRADRAHSRPRRGARAPPGPDGPRRDGPAGQRRRERLGRRRRRVAPDARAPLPQPGPRPGRAAGDLRWPAVG